MAVEERLFSRLLKFLRLSQIGIGYF